MVPSLSTDANEKLLSLARFQNFAPISASINSPSSIQQLQSIPFFRIMTGGNDNSTQALSLLVAISTVGVVDKPRSITSIPNPVSVAVTSWLTMAPLIRPSRPTTTLAGVPALPACSHNSEPKAAVNFTTSIGERVSPGLPPMVPLIPEILLINATEKRLGLQKYVFRRTQKGRVVLADEFAVTLIQNKMYGHLVPALV